MKAYKFNAGSHLRNSLSCFQTGRAPYRPGLTRWHLSIPGFTFPGSTIPLRSTFGSVALGVPWAAAARRGEGLRCQWCVRHRHRIISGSGTPGPTLWLRRYFTPYLWMRPMCRFIDLVSPGVPCKSLSCSQVLYFAFGSPRELGNQMKKHTRMQRGTWLMMRHGNQTCSISFSFLSYVLGCFLFFFFHFVEFFGQGNKRDFYFLNRGEQTTSIRMYRPWKEV